MIIGISGKSGSGKTTLAHLINDRIEKSIYLDIDKVGHAALKNDEVKKQLVNSFGSLILNKDSIDRKCLSKIVFSSKAAMQKLTDITWKYMQSEIDLFILDNKEKIIILDWALLPKSKYFNMCDIKILLTAPKEKRKERIKSRDNLKDDEFILREQSSINYDFNQFDYIIDNSQENALDVAIELLEGELWK